MWFCESVSVFTFLLDTIPGRQCMASCFFLLRQFEDVLIYLNSIKVNVANKVQVMRVPLPPLLFVGRKRLLKGSNAER